MGLIYFAPLLCFVSGFALGKFHERINWSNLINAGVINKPKGK